MWRVIPAGPQPNDQLAANRGQSAQCREEHRPANREAAFPAQCISFELKIALLGVGAL
jgi:hypothetical protein